MSSSSKSDSEDGSPVAERRSLLFAVPTAAVRASMDTARRVSSNDRPERLSVNTMRRRFLASQQEKANHVARPEKLEALNENKSFYDIKSKQRVSFGDELDLQPFHVMDSKQRVSFQDELDTPNYYDYDEQKKRTMSIGDRVNSAIITSEEKPSMYDEQKKRSKSIGDRVNSARYITRGNDYVSSVTQSTRLWLVISVLFGWLALVNGISYVIIEYVILERNPQWNMKQYEPHRPTDNLPAVLMGAAAISDAQKCMATFSTLDFDVENFDKYDEYFKDDSTLTLAQAGTYYGVEGITEYMAFASNRSPYILNTKLTNVDVQFEKYNSDTGICEFAFHLIKYGETDPKHSRAMIAEYAMVISVKFDMNQNYIKHMGVYLPVGFLSYFFGVIHNTDKTRDFVCSIISDTCSTVLDDPSLKAKNGEECTEKLSKLPTTEGPLKYFDSNSQGCRVLHAILAIERPENHCPHISLTPIPDPNNKIKCQNSTGYLPENQISAKQLQYHKAFMVNTGIDPDMGYKVYDCKGDCTGVPEAALAINETGGGEGEGKWKVTDTVPHSNLSDEQFGVYVGFVLWITVLLAGIGSELLVYILYLQRDGWSEDKDVLWKFAQFVFPLLAATTLGLALERSYLAMPFLVAGLWKFGFPETILYMYMAIASSSSTRIERVIDFVNATGTVTHHGAAAFLISMLLAGVIAPDRHVVGPILILLMQHWFVLLRYVHTNLYIILEIILELWFEWIIISDFQYIAANHWTASLAAGTMLVAHWEYLIAAGLDVVKCEESQIDEDEQLPQQQQGLMTAGDIRNLKINVNDEEDDNLRDEHQGLMDGSTPSKYHDEEEADDKGKHDENASDEESSDEKN